MNLLRRWLIFVISVLLRSTNSFSPTPTALGLSRQRFLFSHGQSLQKDDDLDTCHPATTALLKISYDGGHFTGFYAGNSECYADNEAATTGYVRSVQNTIQDCLARLYGNLPVVVEGCSRTDKGVHARALIAQFYCVDPLLFDGSSDETTMNTFSIPGKRQPYPWNATDSTYFKPLPSDLRTIQYKLNRMLPCDIRIVGIAPLPSLANSDDIFHPTLSCTFKTYEYTFSLGDVHDPTQWRNTWHVGDNALDHGGMLAACEAFVGAHDFSAFRGAPRSKDDKNKQLTQSTICTIRNMDIHEDATRSWSDNTKVYKVSVTGDRFLHKMVRFLVGSVVAVGRHKLSADNLRRALTTGHREDLPLFECAPAKGLVLVNVEYNGTEIDWV
jgi:tRNA pseudouridine38-40 synthase